MSQQSEQPIVHPELDLQKENLDFAETGGVSQENGQLSFVPAFIDSTNGRVEISRFSNGLPAPFHSLDGLPDSWVTSQDRAGGGVGCERVCDRRVCKDGAVFYTSGSS